MQRAVTVTTPIGEAFDRVLADPLVEVFDRRFAVIPAITREVRLRGTGPWGTAVGQQRRVHLADGGSMTETLRTADPPHSATYTMTDLRGPFALVVSAVDGSWRLMEVEGGTRIVWSWRLQPRGRLGRAALPLLVRCWHGYADLALERLRQRLDGR